MSNEYDLQYIRQQARYRQDQKIAKWCRELKISKHKIEHHPYCADIRTLLDFDSLDQWFNEKDRSIWTHCWQWVYTKELPLTEYHRKRLRRILDGIEFRQARLKHIQKRKDKQAARLKMSEKEDQDNEAKGSCQPS